jgi:hypothetical protein
MATSVIDGIATVCLQFLDIRLQQITSWPEIDDMVGAPRVVRRAPRLSVGEAFEHLPELTPKRCREHGALLRLTLGLYAFTYELHWNLHA